MVSELFELIGQYIRIRYDIELVFSVFFLHFGSVEAESVFPCDFVAGGEVVDLLELVQTLVQVGLARRGRPQQVPFVTLSVTKTIRFK
jgi:hypothetical protein